MSQSATQSRQTESPPDGRGVREVLLPGATVGFGLGAVVDVVLFHLVLQHHHLLSGYVDPHVDGGFRENVLYDGLFLLLMLGVTFVGLLALWRAANGTTVRLSNTSLAGAVLVGAGLFNTLDGVVSHYVLGLHDVVHDTTVWNPHWVVVSLLLLGTGAGILLLDRRGS